MQRTHELPGLAQVFVKRSSFFQCLWIEENDDIQFRSCLVIGLDAIQIALHHPSGRGSARFVRRLHIADGGFLNPYLRPRGHNRNNH